MITRINLIEKQPFTFTYLKLVQIIGVILILMGLSVGNQFFQNYRATRGIASRQADLTKLKAEHDSLRLRPTKRKMDIGRFQDLVDKIEGAPRWSRILNEISLRMPGRLKLTAIKSLAPNSEKSIQVSRKKDKDAKVEDKEKDKEAKAKKLKEAMKQDLTMRRLEITGLSTDERLVTEFLKQMRGSEPFRNAVLTDSQRDTFGYSFKIISEAVNGVK